MQRRAFLQSLSAPLGMVLFDFVFSSPQQTVDLEKFAGLRANLLEMVNEERAVAKVQPLAMDPLATRVATQHATEMAMHEFASHWGRDGFKPYHRYSFAGGTDATQENVSAADNTWSNKMSDLKQDTSYLHLRLYQEQPPNDGHRKTILAPQHTHVGFGIAVEKLRLRLVEMFVARYVEVEAMPRVAKPRGVVQFAAKMLKRGHSLNHVEVFYEPLPKAPEMSWLNEARSYELPHNSKMLRPKVTPPFMYMDRTRGDVDVDLDGNFSVPVTLLHDKPGIYTIVAWLKPGSGKAFPATEVCIQTTER
ncbi:MAG TPA: CAP domain-containing protein [Pyrinomonadaceae bacterium]|nr:CAP domain-containing protein [Pyrinomonadaceae bacterium]